jgi:manganese transport protein
VTAVAHAGRPVRVRLALLGPAFVASIAYVDPGNVATNTTAGSKYGYLLVWVVVAANVLAMLVQYLSAKLGIATGKSLPRLCREEYSRASSTALWIQAETVALATDLAEVLGGALALRLLFDLPLVTGGVLTGVVSFAILALQGPKHQRVFEHAILLLLGVIAVGFLWSAVVSHPDPVAAAEGLVPRFDGSDSVLLAAGMLGATVMPHAIYLHSALIYDRFGNRTNDHSARRTLLRATRVDVVIAMSIAGVVNLAMVLFAAAALQGRGIDTIEGVHEALGDTLGPASALMFAIGLLASGFASSSVGTYAGAVILEGFMGRRLALPIRRLVTLAPAVAILAAGIDATDALVLSQVVLSFGIPFALFPLIRLTRDRALMNELVNRRLTTVAGTVAAIMVSALNVLLIGLTLGLG